MAATPLEHPDLDGPASVMAALESAHSVLTDELVDEPGHPTRDALDQVLELFRRRLREPSGPA